MKYGLDKDLKAMLGILRLLIMKIMQFQVSIRKGLFVYRALCGLQISITGNVMKN